MTPTQLSPVSYASSNFRKHTSGNPLQRHLLGRFHNAALALAGQITPAPRRILDAGCGEGFAMSAIFGSVPAELVGIDGSPEAAQLARQLNPGRGFAAGDLYALPFPNRSFDLVVCLEVLEHLDQPEQGLAELVRVSAGWLLISVPHEPLFRGANFLRGKNVAAWGNDPGHVNHWSHRGFLRFLGSQCRVVASRTSFPWSLALCHAS